MPGAPMRCSQICGCTMTAGCTVAAFMGRLDWMVGLASVLVLFSSLWAFHGTCVVCVTYL